MFRQWLCVRKSQTGPLDPPGGRWETLPVSYIERSRCRLDSGCTIDVTGRSKPDQTHWRLFPKNRGFSVSGGRNSTTQVRTSVESKSSPCLESYKNNSYLPICLSSSKNYFKSSTSRLVQTTGRTKES